MANNDTDHTSSSKTESRSNIITAHIPTTESELRNLYLDRCHVVKNNTPNPSVKLVDAYSYISLQYAISDFLSKGKLPAEIAEEKLSRVSYLQWSKISKEIFKRAQNINSVFTKLDSQFQ